MADLENSKILGRLFKSGALREPLTMALDGYNAPLIGKWTRSRDKSTVDVERVHNDKVYYRRNDGELMVTCRSVFLAKHLRVSVICIRGEK